MALALIGFRLGLTLSGSKYSTQVNRQQAFEIAVVGVDEAAQRTNAQTIAGSFITAYEALSKLPVTKYELSEVWRDDSATIPDADPFDVMKLTVALDAAGDEKATIRILAPEDNAVSGRNYDDSFAPYQTLMNMFKGDSYMRISDGETVRDSDQILAGRLISEKTGKSFS